MLVFRIKDSNSTSFKLKLLVYKTIAPLGEKEPSSDTPKPRGVKKITYVSWDDFVTLRIE